MRQFGYVRKRQYLWKSSRISKANECITEMEADVGGLWFLEIRAEVTAASVHHTFRFRLKVSEPVTPCLSTSSDELLMKSRCGSRVESGVWILLIFYRLPCCFSSPLLSCSSFLLSDFVCIKIKQIKCRSTLAVYNLGCQMMGCSRDFFKCL